MHEVRQLVIASYFFIFLRDQGIGLFGLFLQNKQPRNKQQPTNQGETTVKKEHWTY